MPVVVLHREIQETNTNPMALPWTTRSVTHNKNCCVESQLLSGQMHRECCEVSMNNIKALLGCFRGSCQLGQTLVLKDVCIITVKNLVECR